MTIIKLIKLFKKIYQEKPKKMKRGGLAKKYSDNQIALICMIMAFKNIHDFKAIVRYLHNNKKLCQTIGLSEVPHRTTVSRRTKNISKKMREMIISVGQSYCKRQTDQYLVASMDGSLFESSSPKWHKKYRKLGIIPGKLRNIDRESKWGFSFTKGWIQGYKGHFNVVHDINGRSIPFPIDAVVTTANISDFKKRSYFIFPITGECSLSTC